MALPLCWRERNKKRAICLLNHVAGASGKGQDAREVPWRDVRREFMLEVVTFQVLACSKGKRLSMCKAFGICEAVSRSKQLEELQRFTVQKLRTACFG